MLSSYSFLSLSNNCRSTVELIAHALTMISNLKNFENRFRIHHKTIISNTNEKHIFCFLTLKGLPRQNRCCRCLRIPVKSMPTKLFRNSAIRPASLFNSWPRSSPLRNEARRLVYLHFKDKRMAFTSVLCVECGKNFVSVDFLFFSCTQVADFCILTAFHVVA